MRSIPRTESFPAHTPAVSQVFTIVLSHGPLTRLEVARRAGLSAAAVTKAVRPLMEWRDVRLAELAAMTPGLPVTVDNDVRALTVAEQWFGTGAGLTDFAVVTVGAGIGCGLVVHGQVVAGAHGVAGEIGHVVVDPAGPRRHCGNR